MYSRIIPKLLAHKDVCALSDDGNPGAFNVFAHCGAGLGALCLLLDVLKGFIVVFPACFCLDTANPMFAVVMAAPVLGHALGAFNRFHGGKCISTSFGVMFAIMPVTFWGIILLAAIYIFFAGIVRIKSNRICSIVTYSLFLVITSIVLNLLRLHSVALGCAIIAVIAVVKHLNLSAVVDKDGVKNEEHDC